MWKGLALLLMLAIAGCTSPVEDTNSIPEANLMHISGTVYGLDLNPLAAEIVLEQTEDVTQTNGMGQFEFRDLRPDLYTLHVKAPGHASKTIGVLPTEGDQSVIIRLIPFMEEPLNYTEHTRGHMQCMAEYGIVSGDCDALAVYINEETPLSGAPENWDGNATLYVDMPANWRTMVVDLDFEPESQPGFQGMRVSVYGYRADAEVLDYERITQVSGQDSFTLRLDAGQVYEDGVPVSSNQTSFRLEIFAEGRGYKPTCVQERCPMGFGAGLDVSFDTYVTTFVVNPAPADWSLLE